VADTVADLNDDLQAGGGPSGPADSDGTAHDWLSATPQCRSPGSRQGVEGQPRDTDRGEGVPSVLTQYLDERLTGRVGDLRPRTEARRAGHEDQHLRDTDPVQVAHSLHSGGEALGAG
jgi:hypothetical protein